MRRARVIAIPLVLLGTATLAVAQLVPTDEAGEVILHEPIPGDQSLMAAPSDAPVFVYEDGDDPGGLPAVIRRDGVALPAPSAGVEDSGDDLLYRTADPSQAQPAPGTVHNVESEVRPDRETGREPWLRYHAVFDPAIIPFKRNSAKDRVTESGAIVTADPTLRPVEVIGNQATEGREVFWGSVLVELDPGVPVPLPSVSPESRILSYETVPKVPMRFFEDGADNFFADGGSFSGRVRVNFVMDAPATWFAQDIPSGLSASEVPAELRPALPEALVADVERVARAIGIRAGDDYGETLRKLVYYYRSFRPGNLEDDAHGGIYVDLALGRVGVCRHRAYAFVITAHGLGLPARYVSNEAHVFVEVYVPRAGWLRVDLGGGAEGMDVRNSSQKTRHEVEGDDAFGFPPGFTSGYSQRALDEGPEGDGGEPVRGLPPAPTRAQGPNRPDPGGMPMWPTVTPGGFARAGGPVFQKDETRRQTETSLQQVSAQVYRGDKLHLRGRVTSDGAPVPDGVVRILLMDSDHARVAVELGTARTLANGVFTASVVMPTDVGLGTWEVVAEFTGDPIYSPSHSE